MKTPVAKKAFTGAEGNALVADCIGTWPNPDVVLLAHGGGQTRHAWRGTGLSLARHGLAAVTLDQRGHGDSAWSATGAYAIEDFAQDLALVVGSLAHEAGQPPIVVGASLGGLASLVAIGEGLAAVRALVLVDVTPRLDGDGVAKVQGFMGERTEEGFASLEEAAEAVARYLPHRPRPPSLDGLRKNLRLGDDGRWRWHWDPRFLRGPRTVNTGREATLERAVAAAHRLTIPVLLVRGGASELVNEESVREFLSLVPHADFVDVAGARHMVAGDANDAFTAAVLNFSQRVGGKSRVA